MIRGIFAGLAAAAIVVAGCDSQQTTKKQVTTESKDASGATIHKTETKTTETKPK